MTSSGTYTFSLSNGEGVIDAYERCGILMPMLEQKHLYSDLLHVNNHQMLGLLHLLNVRQYLKIVF